MTGPMRATGANQSMRGVQRAVDQQRVRGDRQQALLEDIDRRVKIIEARLASNKQLIDGLADLGLTAIQDSVIDGGAA